MTEKILWEICSAMIGLVGFLHLRATLGTNKLHPRNEKLITDMKDSTLLMTNQLTLHGSALYFHTY